MIAQQKNKQWMDVEIVEDLVGISGGFLHRPLTAPCIRVLSGSTTHRFVEVAKNSEWFLKAVGGAGTQKGDLKSVNVLEDMRKQLEDIENAAVAGDAAVADANDEAEMEHDPMDEIDDVQDTPTKAKNKTKPKSKKQAPQSSIVHLDMPRRPLCACHDEGTVKVAVYCQARKFQNYKTAKMLLSTDCIAWLIAYVHASRIRARFSAERSQVSFTTSQISCNVDCW